MRGQGRRNSSSTVLTTKHAFVAITCVIATLTLLSVVFYSRLLKTPENPCKLELNKLRAERVELLNIALAPIAVENTATPKIPESPCHPEDIKHTERLAALQGKVKQLEGRNAAERYYKPLPFSLHYFPYPLRSKRVKAEKATASSSDFLFAAKAELKQCSDNQAVCRDELKREQAAKRDTESAAAAAAAAAAASASTPLCGGSSNGGDVLVVIGVPTVPRQVRPHTPHTLHTPHTPHTLHTPHTPHTLTPHLTSGGGGGGRRVRTT
jgi:hypothetical protein